MTNAEILVVLNARLKRAETAITEEIRAGLTYCSQKRWPCLHTSATVALVAGNNSIAIPAGFRELDKITLNNGTVEDDPLLKVNWDFILKSRSGSPGQAEPTAYCKRGLKLELDSACNAAYTATVYYWQFHPNQATILFGEEFREAVFNAVMYKYLEGKKMVEEAMYFKSIADSELEKLSPMEDVITKQVTYQDM